MTEFIDIHESIVSKLNKLAPNVEVNSSDIEEGFSRPCFYIKIINIKSENLMSKFQEKKISLDIIYFPEHQKKNQEDLLNMADILNKAFVENQTIEITKDLIVESEDISIFEVDKILHCTFNIFIAEEYEKAYEYDMEELEFKEGIDANE